MQLAQGTTLCNGRYVIKTCIGDGGFGITYVADDVRLDREIVLKEYFPDFMAKRDITVSNEVQTIDMKQSEDMHTGISKFMKEAKTLALLNHIPAIATVHDYFEENNTAYIVMEYIKGKNLKQFIRERQTPFTFAEAMAILEPCMFALQKVHEAGIIHRDFAPDNILINDRNQVKIIDFGASRDYVASSATMTIMVKHGYAPAEQYSNAVKQGPYTDVYSLGAILYEMLTLEKPMPSIDRMIADKLPVPSTVNPTITPVQDAVVMKGLAVVFSSRYQTVEEFLNALKDAENPNAVMPNFGQTYNSDSTVLMGNADAVATEFVGTGATGSIPATEFVGGASTPYPSTSQQYYQAPVQEASQQYYQAPVQEASQQYYQAPVQEASQQYYQAPVQEASQSIAQGDYSGVNQYNQGYAAANTTDKKSKKGIIIGAVCGIVAVLVITIVGIVIGAGGSKSSTTKDEKSDKKTSSYGSDTPDPVGSDLADTKAAVEVQEEIAEAPEVATDEFGDTGSVLNIRLWNEEFKSRVEDHYPGYEVVDSVTGKIGDVTVNWIIVPIDNNGYQDALDIALASQSSTAADDKVDMFLAEPDYIKKYVESDYAMPVSEAGITSSDTSDMYQYTKDIGTDSNGQLKALTWQCCPCGLIYNREIAIAVFGSDDPEVVQEHVKDWDAFCATTQEMAEYGYDATATIYDMFRAYTSSNSSSPWVKSGYIQIPDGAADWADNTYMSSQIYGNTSYEGMWGDAWANGFYGDDVFCYYGPDWLVSYCMYGEDSSSIAYNGGWGICEGPQAGYWGGTFVLIAEGSDNAGLCADIMRTLTSYDVAYDIATIGYDFANNVSAMDYLAANPTYSENYLGGINALPYYNANCKKITCKAMTEYDYELGEIFKDCITGYLTGDASAEDAVNAYLSEAQSTFPELKVNN